MEIIIKNIKQTFLDLLFPHSKILDNINTEVIREIKKPENWDDSDTIVLFDYKDKNAKKLIWELKYKNNLSAAKILAEAMHGEILENLHDWSAFDNFQNPILLPVPLSKKKLLKRGYNQTEILAKEIIERDGGKNLETSSNILKKIKETKDQSSLKTKIARSNNLKDCFKVTNPEKIKGRSVILIDDVITTGATLREIKKVLKKSGAKKIKALVVAH